MQEPGDGGHVYVAHVSIKFKSILSIILLSLNVYYYMQVAL